MLAAVPTSLSCGTGAGVPKAFLLPACHSGRRIVGPLLALSRDLLLAGHFIQMWCNGRDTRKRRRRCERDANG
jgi:hypothetical protein